MDTITSLLALLTGLIIRLAIPLVITALLIFLLRTLDARWQDEAQRLVPVVEKPECWKIKGCPPEQRLNCPGAKSALPCWQAYRSANGYLRQECLTCEVFLKAPSPTLHAEPRRM